MKCGCLWAPPPHPTFVLKSPLRFARQWSREKPCNFVPKAFTISNVDYCFSRSPNIFYDKTGVTDQCLRCVNRTDLAVSLQVRKKNITMHCT